MVAASAALEDRDTVSAARAEVRHRELAEDLLHLRSEGVIEHLLAAERAILQEELDRFADTTAMQSSLQGALEELAGAVAMLPRVRDPVMYREVDAVYMFKANRVGGLPRDDARRFFASHSARLLNLSKARARPGEKAVISARSANIRTAERLYRSLQLEALGVERPPAVEDLASTDR